jgi:hypothetical protein
MNESIKVTIIYEGIPYEVEEAIHGPSRTQGELRGLLDATQSKLFDCERQLQEAKNQIDSCVKLRDENNRLHNLIATEVREKTQLRIANDKMNDELGFEHQALLDVKSELNKAREHIQKLEKCLKGNEPDHPASLMTRDTLKTFLMILSRDGLDTYRYGNDGKFPRKIDLIKTLRSATGQGLRECKTLVDWALSE